MTYAKTIQNLREILVTDGRKSNGKSKTTTIQQQFNSAIEQLKQQYGISGFDISFLYKITNDYSLNIKQRVGRLLRNAVMEQRLKIVYGKQYKKKKLYVIQ